MRRPAPRQMRKALDAARVAEFTPSTTVVETLRDQMDRGTFTAVGWTAPPHLSTEGWLHTGAAILALERATPWCWADWWLARGARALPAEWRGPDLRTLDNYAVVARAYSNSRRREFVSFKHHAELVSVSETEQDALLDWCVTVHPSVAGLRSERQRRAAALLPPKPPPRAEVTRVEPPPRSPAEPPDSDIAIPVQLFLPAELLAWVTQAAAGEAMPLAAWIIRLIERARE